MLPSVTNLVTQNDPQVDIVDMGSVRLFDHQRAMAHRMLQTEQGGITLADGRTGNTSVGILCDPVGAGKSNTVLCTIASCPKITNTRVVPIRTGIVGSHAYLGVTERRYVQSTGECNLILVPHGGVFRQWKRYITDAGLSMQAYESRRSIEETPTATCVLVSSSIFKEFHQKHCQEYVFNRVVIDEADSIHIPSMQEVTACMYWLVTSSWRNLTYSNGIIPLHNRHGRVTAYGKCDGVRRNGFVKDICKMLLHDFRTCEFAFHCCETSFISRSLNLPPLVFNEIVCRAPSHAASGMLQNMVSSEVATLINAGDISGAISRLGCSTATDIHSLSTALSQNTQTRLAERTARLMYIRNVWGEEDARCADIQQQIDRLREQLRSIQQRCQNIDEDVCPICHDVPGTDGPLCATKCCCKVFCLNCLQKSLAWTQNKCCMCRAAIPDMSSVVVISDTEHYEDFLSKNDRLVELINVKYPDGKFLVFSMHDKTFANIKVLLDANHITNSRLCGNTHQIASTLKRFDNGEIKVLMLNANHFGQGYNLQCATNIVLYHRMTEELTQQMVGRAQRLGRTEPLMVDQLVHVGESMPVLF